ncbi:Nuclease domain-containing protein 1, partial [Stegodyphus mimosarum]
MTSQQPTQAQTGYGIVKQVLSGDTVVIRGHPKGGPPKEKTIGLSSIIAPKLARGPTRNGEGATKDEPFAWEAREFLRKKLIGKEVYFVVEKPVNSNREYGTIYLGKDSSAENVIESLVSEGLVDVRRGAIKSNEAHQRLCELEDNAKSAGKGKHGPNASEHIRTVKWSVDNPATFKDSLHQKPVKAIVEHVRDGSTLRVLLLPDDDYFPEYYSIIVMLSGIRCPTFRGEEQTPEPFAEEAKFYTESRLLQRDVEVILESVSNQNFLGTIIHPNGNITELLLSDGFARCVDWSLQCVTSGLEKLRAAEKSAKEKRLRIWKDYVPSGPVIDAKEKEFQGKVVEVINADAMVVKLADGSTKKIFLASIRPPRLPENSPDASKARIRPLYEIPYMFEAREFLRKKLIGKKVNVTIDYIQPANNNFAEKTCCTVTIGGVNVAEALVSKGFAKVVRYRADDDQRSAHYDELLSAEAKAIKSGKGMHSKKDNPVHRVVELSGDVQKSKQFLPFLQRAGRMEAVVEFVASGSRLRVYVQRENCLITFLLAGITCVRASRETKTGTQPGDLFGDEALAFTKDLCLQKEVQIEVESMDKAGNFIGWLWIDNINLSEALVKEGYAEIHSTAARSPYIRALQTAQEEAQKKKVKMWESHESFEPETKEEEVSERVVNYKKVMVTDVRLDLTFYAQHVDEGPKLEEMMLNLRQEFTSNPPLPGSYTPKKGDMCAALFSDGLWYRAKVDKINGGQISVTFIDYGNKDTVTISELASLPSTYHSLPPGAHEYGLAFVKPSQDTENAIEAKNQFFEETDNQVLLLNVEYRVGSVPYGTLVTVDEKQDIGRELVSRGFIFVEKRKEMKYQKIINEYLAAQDLAKKNRLFLWQYGDITEDDAKEFG